MPRLHACAATVEDLTAQFGLGSVGDTVTSTEDKWRSGKGPPGVAAAAIPQLALF